MSNFIQGTNLHLQAHGIHHTTTHSKLDDIATNTGVNHIDQVLATSAGGLEMVGGETAPIADEDNRDGWLFKKTVADASKINWYFYGAGNTLTNLQDLKSISCILSVDTYTATNSLPFFIVYTKATGSGDASWYKSKITYQLSAGEKILTGEEVQAWCGVKPLKQSNKRMVEFNAISSVGTALDTEELLTIAIHTDSGAGIGTKLLVKQVGFDLYADADKIERRINLTF